MALRDALVAYTRFYSCLLPYRHGFVAGEFEQVTRDFGAVVRRLNERFGTSFAEFLHTDANVRDCYALIKQRPTLSRTLLGFESGLVTREELGRDERRPGSAERTGRARTDHAPAARRRAHRNGCRNGRGTLALQDPGEDTIAAAR